MIRKAFAKINLSLDIVGTRGDGYHLVRMIMQQLALYDEITLEKSREPGIFLTCDVPEIPTGEGNLAFRAADILMKKANVREGVSIHIRKRIPMAAGLAGGSADAAAVLSGVNDLFSIGLDRDELMEEGLKLGADVPYCILGGTALSEGIGEKLTPLAAPPCLPVLLCKVPEGASTGEIYRRYDSLTDVLHPDVDGLAARLEDGTFAEGVRMGLMGNVLERVTMEMIPGIRKISELMKKHGAIGAMMSGSGPAVFGIYEDPVLCSKAKEMLSGAYPEAFTEVTELRSQAMQEE